MPIQLRGETRADGMTTYGEAVYDLARTFIDDARVIDEPMRSQETNELAIEIQRTIDDYFFMRETLRGFNQPGDNGMKETARRQPAAVIAAIQTLVKLGAAHGVDAINDAYRESIAELMAAETRDTWRARITEGQRELALIGN